MVPGVDFMNCFTPIAAHSRLALNICTRKKILKSWAQGVKVGRRGAKPFIKLTPDEWLRISGWLYSRVGKYGFDRCSELVLFGCT